MVDRWAVGRWVIDLVGQACLSQGFGFLVRQRCLAPTADDWLQEDPRLLARMEAGQNETVVVAVEQRKGKALVGPRVLEWVVTDDPDTLHGEPTLALEPLDATCDCRQLRLDTAQVAQQLEFAVGLRPGLAAPGEPPDAHEQDQAEQQGEQREDHRDDRKGTRQRVRNEFASPHTGASWSGRF